MLNKNLNNFYKYIQANQIDEANNEINKLLQSDPDDFLLLHCLANVLYKKNNFLEAIKVFKKSITLSVSVTKKLDFLEVVYIFLQQLKYLIYIILHFLAQ